MGNDAPLAGHEVRWTFARQFGNLDAPPDYLASRATDAVGLYAVRGLLGGLNSADTLTTTTEGEDGYTPSVHFYLGNVGGNGFDHHGDLGGERGERSDHRRHRGLAQDSHPMGEDGRLQRQPAQGGGAVAPAIRAYFAPAFIDVTTPGMLTRAFTFNVDVYDFGMTRVEQRDKSSCSRKASSWRRVISTGCACPETPTIYAGSGARTAPPGRTAVTV